MVHAPPISISHPSPPPLHVDVTTVPSPELSLQSRCVVETQFDVFASIHCVSVVESISPPGPQAVPSTNSQPSVSVIEPSHANELLLH